MVRGKLNVGKKTEGLRYSIAAKTIPDCGEAPFIKWEGTTNVTAGQVFGLFGPMEESKADKTAEAMTWLQGFLAAKAKPASEVNAAAKRVGIADRTLDRAKGKLKIRSAKRAEGWVWELPAGDEERQLEVLRTSTDSYSHRQAAISMGRGLVSNLRIWCAARNHCTDGTDYRRLLSRHSS